MLEYGYPLARSLSDAYRADGTGNPAVHEEGLGQMYTFALAPYDQSRENRDRVCGRIEVRKGRQVQRDSCCAWPPCGYGVYCTTPSDDAPNFLEGRAIMLRDVRLHKRTPQASRPPLPSSSQRFLD